MTHFLSTPVDRRWLVRWLALTLGLAAVLYQGYNAWIGLAADDSENLETTRVVAAARQLEEGPGTLYGPFSGSNPLVLIHAPLYYRLTALLAWPMVELGVGPIPASLIAGRLISALSLVGCLVLVYRLAVGDGSPRSAGVWAILLVAASPVIGSFPVTMRPDMLGIFLQTLGFALVWWGLERGNPGGRTLTAAYLAFALAVCVKQHYVVGLGLSSLLLGWAWLRGRARPGPIVLAHAACVLVIAAYYGLEEAATHGMMSQSIFVLPKALREVSSGSWSYVGTVFVETGKRSIGLIALGVACLLGRRNWRGLSPLDLTLVVFLALELVVMVALCLNSAGAWYNYAMQAVVCASILIGRSLAGLTVSAAPVSPAAARPAWVPMAVGVAALAALGATARLVAISVTSRLGDQAALRALLTDPRVERRPRAERFFAQLPQYNRMFGRPDLIVDDWLYGSFEAAAGAEPRSAWLRPTLTEGPVRLVVIPERERPVVPGLGEPLDGLGYEHVAHYGPYHVWERR